LENAIVSQLYSFLIYLISGILIGVFFDIFRILRKSFHTPDLVTYLEDILFWVLTGFFLLFVLFQFSNGEIRLYHVNGLLIGGFFYMLSISKFFIKINVYLLTFIKRIIYQIIKIILFPIRPLLRLVRKLLAPISFFVINLQKIIIKTDLKIENTRKKKNKKEKMVTERRILKRNVEKYN